MLSMSSDGLEVGLAHPKRLIVVVHVHFTASYSQVVLISAFHTASTLILKSRDTDISEDLTCISEERLFIEWWQSEFL